MLQYHSDIKQYEVAQYIDVHGSRVRGTSVYVYVLAFYLTKHGGIITDTSELL